MWDLKSEFLGSAHSCTSPVTGLVTAHAWEGQVRVRSQVPDLHPDDSSPEGVLKTQVPAPDGL